MVAPHNPYSVNNQDFTTSYLNVVSKKQTSTRLLLNPYLFIGNSQKLARGHDEFSQLIKWIGLGSVLKELWSSLFAVWSRSKLPLNQLQGDLLWCIDLERAWCMWLMLSKLRLWLLTANQADAVKRWLYIYKAWWRFAFFHLKYKHLIWSLTSLIRPREGESC